MTNAEAQRRGDAEEIENFLIAEEVSYDKYTVFELSIIN